MTVKLVHNKIPRSLKPVVSQFISGKLTRPLIEGGHRVLAPTWENVNQWAPEFRFKAHAFYVKYSSLTVKPTRPSEPNAILGYEINMDEVDTFRYPGVYITMKESGKYPGCALIRVGIDAQVVHETGLSRSGRVVMTPTQSGLHITRSDSGSSLVRGTKPHFSGPFVSYRTVGHPKPEYSSNLILDEGSIIAKFDPELLLRYFGVLVY